MRSQTSHLRRWAISAVVALGAPVWHASLGGIVACAENITSAEVRNDATAQVIAAFAHGGGIRGGEVVWGETTMINGALLGTWSIVSRQDGQILAAGASMPLALSEDQPQQGGSGPAGAIASLEFPAIVQDTTYFNHFELHTQPMGHPFSPLAVNPNRNRVPHFDFHFYSIAEEEVRAIGPAMPPLPPIPPQLLPAGYAQPGPVELVPQMGRHSSPIWALSDPNPLTAIMVAGFLPDASQMHFLEPMVSRDFLLTAQDFTLPVPIPRVFDRATLYPTRFEAVFQGGSHHLIFSDFIDTNPAILEDAAELAHAVPEPGAMTLLGLALPFLLRRRRRRSNSLFTKSRTIPNDDN